MIQPKSNKFRHELKYQITDAQQQFLKNEISRLLALE